MIKILPLENAMVKPHYYIRFAISIDDDSWDDHRRTISDEQHTDSWNYISTEDAEMLVKKWNYWTAKAKESGCNYFRICLNNCWELNQYIRYPDNKDICNHLEGKCMCESLSEKGFSHEDIIEFSELCGKFSDLFDICVEHVWNYLYDISIKYVDENGLEHNCEVC